jgi:hypothetical protein
VAPPGSGVVEMHEIRGDQIVDEEEAWKAVAATLYDGEIVVALGPAKDVNDRTAQPPGHNPWLWVAFTPSRYVEVPFETGNPSSYLLSDVERLEVKRGMLGGRKLVVKTSDAPDSLALEVLDVPSAFAAAIKPLVDMRREAPGLPDEYTRYERVNVPALDEEIATVVGGQTVEFRCVLCRGSCGTESPVDSSATEAAGTHAYERCTGCLRRVEADSDASAS